MQPTTLYGAPHSLYTGRARSYLIKAGITYRELVPNTSHFQQNVLPKAGGRNGMPTIETADGVVVRDGAAIIDHFEAQNGQAFSPATPKQYIVSRLFDVIGAEGLLRPAMHYRWNFDSINLPFLQHHFEMLMPEGAEHRAPGMMDRMRAAGQAFGAIADTFNLVETLYEELLIHLDEHFKHVPYLLGGRPCIGDFGLIAPMFGHLGRDPKPLSLMQSRAPNLFRWVERMNRANQDAAEFDLQDEQYLPDDQIPATLIAVLKHLSVDFVPESQAAADTINHWLVENDVEPGTTAERAVGVAHFRVRNTAISAIAQPYRFYLLARVQAAFAQLDQAEQTDVKTLLSQCDLEQMLQTKLHREIGRANNLEVWL